MVKSATAQGQERDGPRAGRRRVRASRGRRTTGPRSGGDDRKGTAGREGAGVRGRRFGEVIDHLEGNDNRPVRASRLRFRPWARAAFFCQRISYPAGKAGQGPGRRNSWRGGAL